MVGLVACRGLVLQLDDETERSVLVVLVYQLGDFQQFGISHFLYCIIHEMYMFII